MCGIAAVVTATAEPAPSVLGAMVARLRHRGPDASGELRLSGCHLGHARLSILDLEAGAQPMQDAEGRYAITFNGEIYNFAELRHELERAGRRFRTRSDTEVMLQAYAAWGAACLDRFRGMFAFALWDRRRRALFAARDPFGEKPLYFAHGPDGTLVLASEPKALFASGLLRARLDKRSLDAYLALGFLPPDRTIFHGVDVLPPAHYLEWRDGQLRIERYWRPRLGGARLSMAEAVEELQSRLRVAVRRQLVADVPVGAFLSGGLDSSTIVALAQEERSDPLRTFSVGFGSEIDERPHARAVAHRYGTEHHEIDLGTPPVAELLEHMTGVYDEPFADSSHVPTFLISGFARRHVKAVLSGDGGDELFGGYSWHPPLLVAERGHGRSWARWAVLRLLSRLARERIRSLRVRSIAAGMRLRAADPWLRVALNHVVFGPGERRDLWGSAEAALGAPVPDGVYSPPPDLAGFERGLYFDLCCYLPGDILVKVDRAAMAHGLETRAPFLDRDVADLVLALPSSLKVTPNEGKVLLRRAFRETWPPELWRRGKQGFGAPYLAWLERPDVIALRERVLAPRSPVMALLPGASRWCHARPSYRLWVLLVLGLWLERAGVEV